MTSHPASCISDVVPSTLDLKQNAPHSTLVGVGLWARAFTNRGLLHTAALSFQGGWSLWLFAWPLHCHCSICLFRSGLTALFTVAHSKLNWSHGPLARAQSFLFAGRYFLRIQFQISFSICFRDQLKAFLWSDQSYRLSQVSPLTFLRNSFVITDWPLTIVPFLLFSALYQLRFFVCVIYPRVICRGNLAQSVITITAADSNSTGVELFAVRLLSSAILNH